MERALYQVQLSLEKNQASLFTAKKMLNFFKASIMDSYILIENSIKHEKEFQNKILRCD